MLASIQISVLSTAVAAFLWAQGYTSAGLLNDFLEVANFENGTFGAVKFRAISVPLILNVLQRTVLAGGRETYSILEFIPADLGGGAAGVEKARAAPSKSTVLCILLIYSAVLVFLICLTIAVLTCSCHCSKCCQKPKNRAIALGSAHSALLEKVHEKTLSSISQSHKTSTRLRIYHLVIGVLGCLLLLAFLATICVYMYSAALLSSLVVTSAPPETALARFDSSNFTIRSALDNVIRFFLDFLNGSVQSGNISTNAFAQNVTNLLDGKLTTGLGTAFDDILAVFGIDKLLTQGMQLQSDITILSTNMDVIRQENKQVSFRLSEIVGSLKVLHDLIKDGLTKACTLGLSAALNTQCQTLKNTVDILIAPYNPAVIETAPAVILHFLFTELGININQILEQLNQIPELLDKLKGDVIAQVNQHLNLDNFIEPLGNIWATAQEATLNVTTTLNSTSSTTVTWLDNLKMPIEAIVYIPAAVFAVLLCIGIVAIVLYALEMKEYELWRIPDAFPVPIELNGRVKSDVCSNCGFVTHAIILGVISITLGALVVIVIPISTVIANEGCVYLDTENGTAQSDYLINKFIVQQWGPLVEELLTSFSDPEVVTFINLPAPVNVLKAATVLCKPTEPSNSTRSFTQQGLLSAIGWTSLLHADKIVKSKLIMGQIINGRKMILDEVVKIDIASKIPSNLDETTQLVRNITSYFDGVDYTKSILQLQPSTFRIDQMKQYATDLAAFGRALQQLGQAQGGILLTYVAQLNKELTALQLALQSANPLKVAFEEVQKRQMLTTVITKLVTSVNEIRVVVSNQTTLLAPIGPIYDAFALEFLTELQTNLTIESMQLTMALLPCDDLYRSVNTAIEAICRHDGLLTRLFAWGYSLVLCILFALLFFLNLFHLSFIQSQQLHRIYELNSSDPVPQVQVLGRTSNETEADRYIPASMLFRGLRTGEVSVDPAAKVKEIVKLGPELRPVQKIITIANSKSMLSRPLNNNGTLASNFGPVKTAALPMEVDLADPSPPITSSIHAPLVSPRSSDSLSDYEVPYARASPRYQETYGNFNRSPALVPSKPHFSPKLTDAAPPIPRPRGPRRLYAETTPPTNTARPQMSTKPETDAKPNFTSF